MHVLGFDTATPGTVVGVLRAEGVAFEGRHDPEPDQRPGHATRLLGLVDEVLEAAGLALGDVARIAVGTGPGSFTGLRIGIATARGLAQATGAELAGVGTLRALARNAPGGPVLAVLDARRGEVFAAAWNGDKEAMAATALTPQALAERVRALAPAPLALGDGAVRFRDQLAPAGAAIPPDGDPLHQVAGRHVCRLGRAAEPAEALVPEYLRPPDARARKP
jgi:tRNA threonylcarbamoyladenosine biosynthesis protein TsaB